MLGLHSSTSGWSILPPGALSAARPFKPGASGKPLNLPCRASSTPIGCSILSDLPAAAAARLAPQSLTVIDDRCKYRVEPGGHLGLQSSCGLSDAAHPVPHAFWLRIGSCCSSRMPSPITRSAASTNKPLDRTRSPGALRWGDILN